ncbi:MAG: helix-turn-helix transcriptional regulator [Rubrivivax sp.]|nr:helix-turn-helix transcriptional regulator [Rubrivivax sp.]
MKARGVRLEYSFQQTGQDSGQQGADVHNPLFDLLQAVHLHGSIQHAARALGSSYRHVWGSLKRWEGELGEPLVSWSQGQPARLTPFADRLLWAETQARARLVPHIEALRAELQRVLQEALDGRQQVLSLHASHDLALPLLRQRAARTHKLHMELHFAGSMDALRALAEGRCAVAGFHVPPLADSRNPFARGLKPLLKPGRHKLIGCMKRCHGLIVPAGNPAGVASLADAAGARYVNRQGGSGTRLLAEHLLLQQGLAVPPGFDDRVEDSHLAVAAAVAGGAGDLGLGVEAAARHYGLGFVPLVDEHYFLVCLKDVLDHPAVLRLRELLSGADWPALLATLPGYAPDRPGEVLSLTRALPWWNYRSPRPGAGSAPPP